MSGRGARNEGGHVARGGRLSPDRPQERAVTARLRRLGSEAGTQLVADLWAARGYDTHRPNDNGRAAPPVVEATRGGETVTVGVVSPPRVRRARLPDPAPDVVAVFGDPGPVAARLDGGTEVLGPADLAGMLLYAVDRSVADELCERHLGAPPDRLGVPAPAAVRRRLSSLGSATPSAASGMRVAGLGLAALLVALALVTLGGSGGPGTGTSAGDIDAASSGAGEPDEAAAVDPDGGGEFPETYPQGTAGLLPPGVTQEGVDDPGALARAHSQRLEGRSYALNVTRHQPVASGATPADPRLNRYLFGSLPQPGVTHTTAFAVAGDAYRSRATLKNGDGVRVRASVYFTDGEWYVAAPLYGNTSFRSAPVSGSVGPLPDTFRTELVDRYLSTPETDLTGVVDHDGRRLYRVVANGTPRPFPDPFVRNYTAVALVDSRGVVHDLSVSYAIVSDDNRATVETSVSYSAFGSVSVRPPSWYINRFDER